MTFGQRLRTARKEKKLTQKELASKINAAHNSISNWENDQNMPDPDTIQNLCWVLDVQPNYFFSSELVPQIPHIRDSNTLSPEEEQILYKYHHGQLLSDMTEEEITIIKKFRRLDDRGKSSVLNILDHEYDSLPGEIPSPAPKKA